MTAGKEGLRILVTGASAGLGAAIAGGAAARGHRVLAGGRRFAALRQSSLGPTVSEIALDVRSDVSCRAAAATMMEKFDGIDVLVANAGVASVGALEETPVDEFRRVMDVNFFGSIRIIQAVLPLMRNARSGVIVAISSLSGLIGLPGDSAYAASKHALEGALESLAGEVSRFGVRVVLVEPGAIATGLMTRVSHAASHARSPYRAFHDHLRVRTSDAAGAEPATIAAEILSLIESPDATLRRPVGDQARAVVKSLASQSAEARAAFSVRAAGLSWWVAGADGPEDS
jgi:NAD(P)-dependent dehydrogenase (short-subunit alcohol dehydrogenase family)